METTHIKKYTVIWIVTLAIIFILVYLFGLTNVKPVTLKPTPVPRELSEQDTLNLLTEMQKVPVKPMSKEATLSMLKQISTSHQSTTTINKKK